MPAEFPALPTTFWCPLPRRPAGTCAVEVGFDQDPAASGEGPAVLAASPGVRAGNTCTAVAALSDGLMPGAAYTLGLPIGPSDSPRDIAVGPVRLWLERCVRGPRRRHARRRLYCAFVKQPVPRIAVPRLATYLRCLEDLPPGMSRISSEDLAARAGVNSPKVRKDLSYLGSFGVRGVGYDVDHLRFQIRRELGLTREWSLVIVGVGNLGRALANYDGFREQGFRVVGIFDDDPNKVGTRVGEHRVEALEALPAAVRHRGAHIGLIATPPEAAQSVAETLAAAGVASILNFAPTVVRVPRNVLVRRVEFSTELQVLAFHLHHGLEAG